MNARLRITAPAHPEVSLTAAVWDDADSLREWKNANREWFFHKDVISAEQQQKWFEGYLARPDDFVFIVERQGARIGCLAFRWRDGALDGYNVIRATAESSGGAMRTAMLMMCAFAESRYGGLMRLKVLSGNPALGWYAKAGFVVEREEPDHVVIVRDARQALPDVTVEREGTGADHG